MGHREVIQLTPDGKNVAKFSNLSEALKKTGVKNINRCCTGHRKTAGGYMWKYGNRLLPKIPVNSSNKVKKMEIVRNISLKKCHLIIQDDII